MWVALSWSLGLRVRDLGFGSGSGVWGFRWVLGSEGLELGFGVWVGCGV